METNRPIKWVWVFWRLSQKTLNFIKFDLFQSDWLKETQETQKLKVNLPKSNKEQ